MHIITIGMHAWSEQTLIKTMNKTKYTSLETELEKSDSTVSVSSDDNNHICCHNGFTD